QLWGNEVWKEGEALQLEMGKRLLRCSSMTTGEAVRGDLGWWTLQARRDLQKLMYFFHLISIPDTRILKQAYRMSKWSPEKKSWGNSIRNILAKYDLSNLWNDENRIWNLDGKGNGESGSKWLYGVFHIGKISRD